MARLAASSTTTSTSPPSPDNITITHSLAIPASSPSTIMDKIEDLAQKASQLTMYDLKSYYNHAKNMVLNVSEMEAKVREATNDDAWGASSTLMKEIAEGTHTFSTFNEIMPTIYSRFMEKEAREWRQIYKALTLLEYLVKNGSERVVDDARSHISTVKMLRSFHYIDQAGKDQGINVRNRAKELSDLLGDVDRIRRERRKAKANRDKYRGVEGGGGGGGMSFQAMTGSRYGGFGSESGAGGGGGGYDGDVYRGGSGASSYNDQARRGGGFDEYDAGDDEEDQGSSGRRSAGANRNGAGAGGGTRSTRGATASSSSKSSAATPVEAKKAPIVDLFSFGDDEDTIPPAATAAAAAATTAGSSSLVDDDFDDFQAAPSAVAGGGPTTAPNNNNNLFDLLDAVPTSAIPRTQQLSSAPPAYTAQQPAISSFQPVQQKQPAYASYTLNSSSTASSAAAPKPKPSGGGFDDLWTTSLGSIGGGGVSPGATSKNKSIQELEREKTMASLWGATTSPSPSTLTNAPRGPALPTMGSAAGSSKPTSSTTTFDDLLG